MLGSRIGGAGADQTVRERAAVASHAGPQRSETAVPGINEVWRLVSGTRSNPPHGSAHGPGADGRGGYAGADGRLGPYAGREGTSEAAEYYYEDQYNQQQYPYDPYAESSAEYFEQAPYGAGSGYQPDLPAAPYEATSFEPGFYPETGYAPDYPPEYGPESSYGAPAAAGRATRRQNPCATPTAAPASRSRSSRQAAG